MEEYKLDIANLRGEAGRLNKLGIVELTYIRPFPLNGSRTVRGRIVGFAISDDERDCLVIRVPDRVDKSRNVQLVIKDHNIRTIMLKDEETRQKMKISSDRGFLATRFGGNPRLN